MKRKSVRKISLQAYISLSMMMSLRCYDSTSTIIIQEEEMEVTGMITSTSQFLNTT